MASGWSGNLVSVTFWNDVRVRGWSDDGRLCALYLLTTPHRSGEGFFHLSLRQAADDLGWSDERFEAALDELRADDFVDVDPVSRLVLIVKALKHAHRIRGHNSITGALAALDRAKGSPRLFGRFLAAADTHQTELAEAIRERYSLPEGPYEGSS